MERLPKQLEKFEISPEQQETVNFINSEMEDFLETVDIEDPKGVDKLNNFMDERTKFQEELESDGILFDSIYLWHVLVGSTIPGSDKIKSFDTPDGRIEEFIRKRLLPIIQKGQ